ncbi:RlpA-like double-psi beta-barrel-protein domain-containing protein-containing protein [Pseudoneurospora amorphoporcata]|uniref:RlpA-like double-psi beta-barrel-protein domain-containing protein-containing protein n=1 Tax=Pseudoneurospora amorphoporcata TaxID=241081 RepID=A0AAN6NQI3_9PEZI|nr:RlpA-like double-psi beta-barrel-protein domain-containing protein-containing protein [Pseudoneurospora amorphoporcata]
MLFQAALVNALSLLILPFAAAAPAAAAGAVALIAERDASPDITPSNPLDPRSFSSRITWYNTGLGACGSTSNDGQLVVALNHDQFDPSTPNGNPNLNSLCGRNIRVNANGRSVTVKLVDRCAGCPYGGLDLSPAAFSALASLSVGVLQGTWDWA